MKLTLHNFVSDPPREKICQAGVDYLVHECDVSAEEAFAFFDRLVRPRDRFSLEAPDCSLDFWKDGQAIWVEVTCAELWATSEVSLGEARAIIEALYRAEVFGSHIPRTTREWDAYSLPGDSPMPNVAP